MEDLEKERLLELIKHFDNLLENTEDPEEQEELAGLSLYHTHMLQELEEKE